MIFNLPRTLARSRCLLLISSHCDPSPHFISKPSYQLPPVDDPLFKSILVHRQACIRHANTSPLQSASAEVGVVTPLIGDEEQ